MGWMTINVGQSIGPDDVAYLLQSISAAAAYSPSSTYSEGDYCTYQGQLYKANQDISTEESWTAAHWTATSIMAEVGVAIGDIDYDPAGTAGSAVSEHNTSATAHQDIRTALAASLTSTAVVSYT